MNNRMRVVVAVWLLAGLVIGFPMVHIGASRAQEKSEESQTASPFVRGRMLIRFRPETLTTSTETLLAATGARDAGEIPGIGVHIVELPAGADEKAFVQAFKWRPEVEFAELDLLLPPDDLTPNDPSYPNEWHLQKIDAPNAWTSTTGSNSVTIAILDTGVDATHPDLASKMVGGWNFYDNNPDTNDVYGHGTMVAGAAAAATNNSIGVASVVWGCLIMPIRVSDLNGYGSISAMASGLAWAADHGARVANISYRVSSYSTISSAAQYFQAKGGVVTISAGNESSFDSSPDNPYVLTVGATDSSDLHTSWSNTGNNLDLTAPGVSILTTTQGGSYSSVSGTSFSAPITAGVAALVISVNPGLTGDQVQSVLKQSAIDLGAIGWDITYGWGRVNASSAVTVALGQSPPPPPPPDTTPPSITITSPPPGSTVSKSITVSVNALDNVRVVKVELYVDGGLKATSTSAPFNTKWNTQRATKGAHTLQCKASDPAGNIGVSATVTVYK